MVLEQLLEDAGHRANRVKVLVADRPVAGNSAEQSAIHDEVVDEADQASRVVPGVAARIGCCVYAAAALISIVLVWTRSPRAEMPVMGADAGSPFQTSSLRVAAGTSGPQGDAAQPVGDDPGIADRDATDPPFEPVRHIVWISIDTLRSDRMGCYGYELPTSPHLDALAAEAVLFRNAYSHSSGTVLSFMSAHAGTDPVFVGGISQFSVLVEQVDTFVEQLQRAGYYTAAVIRQGHLNPSMGYSQGFDDYTNIEKPNRDKQVSDQAIKTLEALRNRDRTFFWFHYLDTHVPYEAPRDLVEMFQRPPGTDPRLLPRYHYSSTGGINYKHVGSQYRDQIVDGRISATFVNALYDAEVRSMDEQVGRVLDRIRELGMWDETLIVVSADHGEALGEHQTYCQHC
ncbi:MAG: sulfatase, partial [Planctomycetes bacterium]|nr:sulfatase [Planctomycetota bacterium]